VEACVHKKYLVSAAEATLAKDDEKAISNLHKYFDYSMLEKVTKHNAETDTFEFVEWVTKVNQPAAQLAGVCYRLGQHDQALLSVMESIKIS
jgi:hypothetical protein